VLNKSFASSFRAGLDMCISSALYSHNSKHISEPSLQTLICNEKSSAYLFKSGPLIGVSIMLWTLFSSRCLMTLVNEKYQGDAG
jgi:hypothetical protein